MKRFFQRIIDLLKEYTGHVHFGLVEQQEYDSRDYAASNHMPLKEDIIPVRVDLYNTWPLNQKNTNHCTAYATTLCLMLQNIRKEHNKSIFFDPEEQWDHQLEDPGTADEEFGDTISAGPNALKKAGLVFNGKLFSIKKYMYEKKGSWKKYLSKGFPIIVGGRVSRPFVDKDYYWTPTKRNAGIGGHAWLIVGYDDEKRYFICQNSWGRWGDDWTGRFYIDYRDAPLLFRGWVLEI